MRAGETSRAPSTNWPPLGQVDDHLDSCDAGRFIGACNFWHCRVVSRELEGCQSAWMRMPGSFPAETRTGLFERAKVAQSVVDSMENATLAGSNRAVHVSARLLPGQKLPAPCWSVTPPRWPLLPPVTRQNLDDLSARWATCGITRMHVFLS
jgi:hypothetical protein